MYAAELDAAKNYAVLDSQAMKACVITQWGKSVWNISISLSSYSLIGSYDIVSNLHTFL